MNNPWLGWALALAAVIAGYLSYGWKGLALAITAVAFWLLLQFSRALRALRDAARAPVGTVANAVMLHARLRSGMRLPDVLRLTGSLGRKVDQPPPARPDDESWAWADAAGDEVEVLLQQGRVQAWELRRAEKPEAVPPAPPPALEG